MGSSATRARRQDLRTAWGKKSRRVSTVEPDESSAALDQQWHAGRLDPGEHELGVSRAGAAVNQADLDVLFVDLPRPDPAPGSTAAVSAGGFRAVLRGKADPIMALTPFAALALFFTTGPVDVVPDEPGRGDPAVRPREGIGATSGPRSIVRSQLGGNAVLRRPGPPDDVCAAQRPLVGLHAGSP
jgi:hypothetical protein